MMYHSRSSRHTNYPDKTTLPPTQQLIVNSSRFLSCFFSFSVKSSYQKLLRIAESLQRKNFMPHYVANTRIVRQPRGVPMSRYTSVRCSQAHVSRARGHLLTLGIEDLHGTRLDYRLSLLKTAIRFYVRLLVASCIIAIRLTLFTWWDLVWWLKG